MKSWSLEQLGNESVTQVSEYDLDEIRPCDVQMVIHDFRTLIIRINALWSIKMESTKYPYKRLQHHINVIIII